MENIKTWLDKIHLTCQQIGHNYIDIIIDQCGLNFSVIPALWIFSGDKMAVALSGITREYLPGRCAFSGAH